MYRCRNAIFADLESSRSGQTGVKVPTWLGPERAFEPYSSHQPKSARNEDVFCMCALSACLCSHLHSCLLADAWLCCLSHDGFKIRVIFKCTCTRFVVSHRICMFAASELYKLCVYCPVVYVAVGRDLYKYIACISNICTHKNTL